MYVFDNFQRFDRFRDQLLLWILSRLLVIAVDWWRQRWISQPVLISVTEPGWSDFQIHHGKTPSDLGANTVGDPDDRMGHVEATHLHIYFFFLLNFHLGWCSIII